MEQCWCGNRELTEYSRAYYKCDKCHTLISKMEFQDSLEDVENEGSDLYGSNYWEIVMTKEAGKNTLGEVIDMYLSERVLYWLKYILKYIKLGSNIAEAGCGLGQLQYVLKRLGYRQLGFELSPEICSYVEEKLGVRMHCGPFEGENSSYDGVIALDLFEHLMDPLGFIEQCSECLKETGILCLQTPCYDSNLSFDEMKEVKGRFEHLLQEEQHIYLYSKDALMEILKKYGFKYVVFEPAYFGDDYDMFCFASKKEFVINTEEEINNFLDQEENGRLLKAMLVLASEKEELRKQFTEADKDRKERLSQNAELTNELKTVEFESQQRLDQIYILTQQLQESERDRKARADQIDTLSEELKKGEAKHADEVNELVRQLQESETDRTSRLEQINNLSQLLQESEADRASRLEQINTLSQLLQESEEDRAARLEQINTLSQLLQEREAEKSSLLNKLRIHSK